MDQGNMYPLSPPPPPPPPESVLAKRQIWFHPCEQQRLWRVCTYEFRLSLRHWTKISCAGSMSFFIVLWEHRRLWRVYTFAWSSLSLRHSWIISCWLKWRFNASSEGSGKSAHLHRLTLAFVTVRKSHDIVLPQIVNFELFTQQV